MRVYGKTVEVVTPSGEHLRRIPTALAKAMVAAGHAEIAHQNGRVRSIKLIVAASSHAVRIGEPTPASLGGVRFTRRVRSEDHAFWWWEFHPRSNDYE